MSHENHTNAVESKTSVSSHSAPSFIQYIKLSAIILFGLLFLSLILVGLDSAFTPLVGAAICAYLLFPIVKHLELRYKIKRQYAVLFVLFVVIALMSWGLIIAIPRLIDEIQYFLQVLPGAIMNVTNKLSVLLSDLGIEVQLDKTTIIEKIKNYLTSISLHQAFNAALTFKHAVTNVVNALLVILNLFLFPLFFFYIIHDYEKIVSGMKNLIPRQHLAKVIYFYRRVNNILSGYLRGQFLVALILAGLYSIGLSIIGLQFSIIIGVLTGLFSIIPYVGFTLGIVTSLIVAIATQGTLISVIKVIIVFTIVQALEGFIITPRLVGNKVGLTPLTTILALIVGGNLIGLWGILLAIPAAAILKFIGIDVIGWYKRSRFYRKH